MKNFETVFDGFFHAHAPTLIKTEERVTLVFQGRIKSTDQQYLWLCYYESQCWSQPTALTDGFELDCWNPVWFQPIGQDGPWLYFKTSRSANGWEGWQGELLIFDKEIKQFKRFELPIGMLGPTKNTPLEIEDFYIIPSSVETWNRRYSVIERIEKRTGEIEFIRLLSPKEEVMTIQPTLIKLPGLIVALTRSNAGYIYRSDSTDNGKSWETLYPTDFENPNSAITSLFLDEEHGYVLAYNPSKKSRNQLNIVLINANGKMTVIDQITYCNKSVAYPSLIKLSDQKLLLTYSIQQREVHTRVIDICIH